MNSKIVFGVGCGLLLLIGVLWYASLGYGKVSPDTYQVAKAICGACMEKSDKRITKVRELLDDDGAEIEISAKERGWLENMLAMAKDGRWDLAAREARQLMKEQVRSK